MACLPTFGLAGAHPGQWVRVPVSPGAAGTLRAGAEESPLWASDIPGPGKWSLVLPRAEMFAALGEAESKFCVLPSRW